MTTFVGFDFAFVFPVEKYARGRRRENELFSAKSRFLENIFFFNRLPTARSCCCLKITTLAPEKSARGRAQENELVIWRSSFCCSVEKYARGRLVKSELLGHRQDRWKISFSFSHCHSCSCCLQRGG